MRHLIGSEIEFKGEHWIVINVGAVIDNKVYLHCRHTTKFRHAKNGKHWFQIADWFPVSQFS